MTLFEHITSRNKYYFVNKKYYEKMLGIVSFFDLYIDSTTASSVIRYLSTRDSYIFKF